jgi:hypothetical protein
VIVPNAARRLCLALKTLNGPAAFPEGGVQHLDSHAPGDPLVFTLEHCPHTTLPNDAQDAVLSLN